MSERLILLGNEAMGRGLLEIGCTVVTSYPGTPASEILRTAARLAVEEGLHVHAEWSVNEKVAFETALANSYAGRRSAVIMKQVGLNVAADPLMSAAYTGVKGGFLLVSADDPGPHSSQTEQDSRCYAMMAKIPVLDPSAPFEARDMLERACELSEKYEIPVMLRPTTRVCHARQDLEPRPFPRSPGDPLFEKDPARWAATPKFRLQLHRELNEKLDRVAGEPALYPRRVPPPGGLPAEGNPPPDAVVASGVVAAYVTELLSDLGLWERVAFYSTPMPYPLSPDFRQEILSGHERVLVLEETDPVIELQLRNGEKVHGRMTGAVPRAGELLPEVVEDSIRSFLKLEPAIRPRPSQAGGRRPTLCAGCPHRAAFFALKKVFSKGIYPGDIGCYTLGLNLGAVDTVLCMGASISQAAGFYHAYRGKGESMPPIAATIGDSTFFHSGIPALLNAVTQGARFALVVMDNSTTAMTGHQPTPAAGRTLSGETVPAVSIPELVRACGVSFVEESDPYDLKAFTDVLKRARRHVKDPAGGVAVVVAKRPCLMDRSRIQPGDRYVVQVNERCEGCGFCVRHFECPALIFHGEDHPIAIDGELCSGCGVCVHVCPHGALDALVRTA